MITNSKFLFIAIAFLFVGLGNQLSAQCSVNSLSPSSLSFSNSGGTQNITVNFSGSPCFDSFNFSGVPSWLTVTQTNQNTIQVVCQSSSSNRSTLISYTYNGTPGGFSVNQTGTPSTWYRDFDNDTFGDPNNPLVQVSQPSGYVSNDNDCNDFNNAVYPGAPEICDGVDNDCDDLIDENNTIAIPTTTNASPSRCGAGTVTLNATPSSGGNGVRWYTTPATGSNYVSDNNSYTPTVNSSRSYWVSTINLQTGCESNQLLEVTVTINTIPSNPSGNDTLRCGPGTVTLSATAGANANTIRWFSASTGGTLLVTGLNYTPPPLNTTTSYYIESFNQSTSCWSSPRQEIRAVINPLVLEATGANVGRCDSGSVTLVATPGTNGNTIRWYNAQTGGGLLFTGTSFTTPSISSTTTYYAESYNGTGCFAAIRTAIQAQINSSSSWYADTDGDNFGDPNVSVQDCFQPTGYVSDNTDCDDTDENINPSTIWYQDSDTDGLGDPNSTLVQCEQPVGYVLDNSDNCPTLNDPSNSCEVITPYSSDPQEHNYLYSRTYQTEIPGTASNFFEPDANLIQEITFFDGLGRPFQNVGIDQTPDMNDIVTHIAYDQFGRSEKEFLPHDDAGNLGDFRTMAEVNTELHYDDQKYDFTPNPYSEKKLEASPLSRVQKQAAPGAAWAMDGGHEIEFNYLANSIIDDHVKQFDINTAENVIGGIYTYTPTLAPRPDNNGEYDAGELIKTVTKDENHPGTVTNDHTTEEFTDKQGRVVLKRTYDQELPHDTYYVYDDFGNLSYVLPPKMNGAGANMDALGYQYVYDQRNRLVEKKIPGKGWEYIVYNELDQPIMTQDSNQRLVGEWLFTKYDAFGRIAYTGKATEEDSPGVASSRVAIQNNANTDTSELWVDSTGSYTLDGIDIGYDNVAYPNSSITEVLTINYYDNYNFDLAGGALAISSFGISSLTNVHSLTTGSKIKVLDATATNSNAWITTVTHYDEKGRAIHSYSNNTYLGTIDVIKMELDFIGRTKRSRTEHTRNNTTIVTIDNFTYDHVGRLLAQTQCIGDENLADNCSNSSGGAPADLILTGNIDSDTAATNSIVVLPTSNVLDGGILRIDPNLTGGSGEAELIVLNSYDELGRLDDKKVGGDADATEVLNSVGLQTINYDYNVRNWLNRINDPNAMGDDLFAFDIKYDDVGDPSRRLYNGNISQTVWNSANNALAGNTASRNYVYNYDALNRITSATGLPNTNYNVSGIFYDKNGNIERLIREGHTAVDANGLVTDFGVMDDLKYTYTGNQLVSVDDRSTSSATQGFVDGSELATEYTYDQNGNMKTDTNKGIIGITYNHLNLPENVTISGGSISYVYDAMGIKQKKTISTGIVTDYTGNYIYENDKLRFFSTPEGYVEPKNTNDLTQGYNYIYQYKDHLGNVRLSYTDNNGTTEIVEENNYYPFGLEHKGYNSMINGVENNYMTYNGKELDESLGLDWLDFGARNYDASIGRWMNIDPLAEKYYDKSSYIYAMNNPIFFVDPDGQEVDVTELLRKGGKNELYLLINLMANLSDISGQSISVNTDNDGKSILSADGCGDNSNCSDSGSSYVDHLLGSEEKIAVYSTSSGTATPPRQNGVDYIGLDAEQIYGMQKALEDNNVDTRAANVGMIFLHETLHTRTGANYFNSEADKEEKTSSGVFPDPSGKNAASETGPTTDRINKIRSEIGAPIRYIYGNTAGTLYLQIDGTKRQIRYTKQSVPDSYKDKKIE